MAVNIQAPYIHVEDANGNPYVGAKLYVYAVGTTTKLAIYSNEALSVALTNPLTSDSAGNFALAYLAAGNYKLRAETSTGTLIWEFDNLDTGLGAGAGALPISAGGTGATTAAAARTALDVPSNAELTDLASDITDIQAIVQGIVSIPQGRLTLTSATPFIASDVTAGTSVYYTPYIGNLAPIWDGTQYVMRTFAELTLSLASQHTANNLYDVFLFWNSSVVEIVTGPAWSNSTAGSCSRGTGAGSTELERKNGLWTNKNEITGRNGATTYTIDAYKALYVGTIVIDGTNGQISQHVTWGQSRKPGPWNAYNRGKRILLAGDSTASWNYTTSTFRQSRATAGNTLMTLCGLADEYIDVSFTQFSQITSANGAIIGIGKNSTSSTSGQIARNQQPNSGTQELTLTAFFKNLPSIGIHNFNSLEYGVLSTGASNFYGAETDMCRRAEWMA